MERLWSILVPTFRHINSTNDIATFSHQPSSLSGMSGKEKKEKTKKDEKSLWKAENDVEVATQEFNYFNDLLKEELPQLFRLERDFIQPLFQSFAVLSFLS